MIANLAALKTVLQTKKTRYETEYHPFCIGSAHLRFGSIYQS